MFVKTATRLKNQEIKGLKKKQLSLDKKLKIFIIHH